MNVHAQVQHHMIIHSIFVHFAMRNHDRKGWEVK